MDKRSGELRDAASIAVPGQAGFDVLVVGAGFAGSVLAERLANVLGQRVLVVDKRPHIGGNAYDRYDDHGVLVHPYGPHIFHTNSADIFEYLSRFTAWRPYQHRVLSSIDGQLLPVPINLDTVNRLYGMELTSFEMQRWLESVAEPRAEILTSEDAVVSKVGRRSLPQVLSRLHAQAVGHRPVRARCQRDGAHPDAHQPRRPLLHRHLPGDAAARLHAHVRGDALAPQHQGDAQHRLPRDRGLRALAADGLQRPDRRVLQLPPRPPALPQPRVSPRQPRAGAVPAGRHGELPERLRVHAGERVQAPHRAAPRDDLGGVRVPARRGRPVLPGAAARRTPSSTAGTRPTPRRSTASPSSAGWRPTSTTTWTRSSARRWRRSSGSRRRSRPSAPGPAPRPARRPSP